KRTLKNKLKFSKTVVVISVGAAFTNVAIIQVKKSSLIVKYNSFGLQIGGNDFDERLADFVLKHLKNTAYMSVAQVATLRKDCCSAKVALSTSDKVAIEVKIASNKQMLSITKIDFEEVCATSFKRIFDTIEEALFYSDTLYTSVHDVLLVGGSTKIPKIIENVKRIFKCSNIIHCKDDVISNGAAVYTMNNKLKCIEIKDKTVFQYMLESYDKMVIERNTFIPSEIQRCVFVRNGRSSLQLKFWESGDAYYRLIGDFDMEIPVIKDNIAIIAKLSIDENGIICIKAVDYSTLDESLLYLKTRLLTEDIKEMADCTHLCFTDYFTHLSEKQRLFAKNRLVTRIKEMRKKLAITSSESHKAEFIVKIHFALHWIQERSHTKEEFEEKLEEIESEFKDLFCLPVNDYDSDSEEYVEFDYGCENQEQSESRQRFEKFLTLLKSEAIFNQFTHLKGYMKFWSEAKVLRQDAENIFQTSVDSNELIAEQCNVWKILDEWELKLHKENECEKSKQTLLTYLAIIKNQEIFVSKSQTLLSEYLSSVLRDKIEDTERLINSGEESDYKVLKTEIQEFIENNQRKLNIENNKRLKSLCEIRKFVRNYESMIKRVRDDFKKMNLTKCTERAKIWIENNKLAPKEVLDEKLLSLHEEYAQFELIIKDCFSKCYSTGKNELFLGIDIGTSKCKISCIVNGVCRNIYVPACVSVNAFNNCGFTSNVDRYSYFKFVSRNNYDLNQIIRNLIGEKHERVNNYSTLKFKKFKRLLNDEDLFALLLIRLRDIVQEYFKQTIKSLVMSVPTNCSKSLQDTLKSAALIAEFQEVSMISDTTCAVVAHYWNKRFEVGKHLGNERVIFVLSIGATFTSIAIFGIKNGTIEIRFNADGLRIAGNDFDTKLCEFVISKGYKGVHLTNDELVQLKNECEKVKTRLTSVEKVNADFKSVHCYNVLITRNEFEILCNELFRKINSCVKSVMHESAVNVNSVSDVLLVGGTTRMAKIKRDMQTVFPFAELLDYDEGIISIG
ncbi:luminal-binding protein 5-like protein, partial [Leptotrombidium deliense]